MIMVTTSLTLSAFSLSFLQSTKVSSGTFRNDHEVYILNGFSKWAWYIRFRNCIYSNSLITEDFQYLVNNIGYDCHSILGDCSSRQRLLCAIQYD